MTGSCKHSPHLSRLLHAGQAKNIWLAGKAVRLLRGKKERVRQGEEEGWGGFCFISVLSWLWSEWHWIFVISHHPAFLHNIFQTFFELFSPPSPSPSWLSHFSCFNHLACFVCVSTPFPLLIVLIHNLCLDRKQKKGRELLFWWITTGIERERDREKVRKGEKARSGYWSSLLCKLPAWLALCLSVYLPDCHRLYFCLCQRSLALNQNFHILCGQANQVWLSAAILRLVPSGVCSNNKACVLLSFVCRLFPTPGPLYTLTQWLYEEWKEMGRGRMVRLSEKT